MEYVVWRRGRDGREEGGLEGGLGGEESEKNEKKVGRRKVDNKWGKKGTRLQLAIIAVK